MKTHTFFERSCPIEVAPRGKRCASPFSRRAFILAVAAWPALAWVGAAFAQTRKSPIVMGWLTLYSREAAGQRFAVFKEELTALGWTEGSQFAIEERWANGHRDLLPPFATELASIKPALVVAAPAAAAAVVTRVLPETPIVAAGTDLVSVGLAKSLARPSGMVTGVSTLSSDVAEKHLELLLAAGPKLQRVGFLADPHSPVHEQSINAARRSIARYRVEAHSADAGKAEEIGPAISRLAKAGAQALIVLPSATFFVEAQRIARLALANRWPTIGGAIELAQAGTLLAYNANSDATYRRLAYFVDRIMKGAKPGDLPVEQPTKFDLVVNLKTAKALGITISPSIMLQATRVIE